MARAHPNLDRFCHLWGQGVGLKPLFILIGGAAGVGKSHLAALLCEAIPALTPISTTLIRMVMRALQPDPSLPLVALHTYDLDSPEQLVVRARPIMACVNRLAQFTASERQLFVVEGSSIFPGLFEPTSHVHAVELYLRVEDAHTHRSMLGGPTHDRNLTDTQFENCRRMQDLVLDEASRLGKPVVNFDEAEARALEMIEATLA